LINTAVIGSGYWGPNIIRILNSISDLKIIIDINATNFNTLKLKYPNITFLTDIEELHNFDIQAIAIVTPPSTHYELASKLSKYHLFIEKPLTNSLYDAKKLISLENKSLFNCVGHIFLFSPEIRKLKQLIENNVIGKIKTINITRLNFGKYQSCGVEVDLLPHDLSILQYLLGELIPSSSCYGKLNNINVSGCAIIKAGEIECIITSSWTSTSKIRCLSINSTTGIFEYDMNRPNIIKHYDCNLENNNIGKLQEMEVESSDEPLLAELKYWLNNIENRPIENIISWENGYKIVKLIDAIKNK
jgi:predicted dehydrogenase